MLRFLAYRSKSSFKKLVAMSGSFLLVMLVFALLGVRLGWSMRLLLLAPLAFAAIAASWAFQSSLWQVGLSTLILNVAAQGGFCVGALSAMAKPAPTRFEVGTDQRI